jgi:hypothetical protein
LFQEVKKYLKETLKTITSEIIIIIEILESNSEVKSLEEVKEIDSNLFQIFNIV